MSVSFCPHMESVVLGAARLVIFKLMLASVDGAQTSYNLLLDSSQVLHVEISSQAAWDNWDKSVNWMWGWWVNGFILCPAYIKPTSLLTASRGRLLYRQKASNYQNGCEGMNKKVENLGGQINHSKVQAFYFFSIFSAYKTPGHNHKVINA